MVIVDTTVWIDYLRGSENPHTLWLEREMDRQPLGLTDLILCEVLQGLPRNSSFNEIRDHLLTKFHVFDSGTKELAVVAATNFRSLRARGYTVRKTIDCLIATFCLEAGHTLLHRDRDFDPFENVLGMNVVQA